MLFDITRFRVPIRDYIDPPLSQTTACRAAGRSAALTPSSERWPLPERYGGCYGDGRGAELTVTRRDYLDPHGNGRRDDAPGAAVGPLAGRAGSPARRTARRVAAAGRPAGGGDRRGNRHADPAAGTIVAHLRGGASVATTAEAIGLSERQLHRRSLDAFGYGPKTLARVLRMVREVTLARADMPFAAVAAVAGYADQAHLAREVKAQAGIGLTPLTR
jgi:AraC-like DNA-binding protein